jgi:hypothetical protein
MSEQYRAEAVAKIEAEISRQREAAIEDIRAIQESCPHDRIIESTAGSDSLGWKCGRRICAACGLEEAANWSWPSRTVDGGLYRFMRPAGRATILNTEFVKYGDVCKFRVNV